MAIYIARWLDLLGWLVNIGSIRLFGELLAPRLSNSLAWNR